MIRPHLSLRQHAVMFTAIILVAFAVLIRATPNAYAQSATATLSGTVEDEKGAVIPGASVTLTNTATRLTRQATTNGDGYFTVPLLPPGTYTVRIEAQGFTVVETGDIVLNVSDQRSLQIQLKVGQIKGEAVEVNADHSLVETSPSVGTVVDRRFVENLPLNGRSFQSLISLTPGVTLTSADTINHGQFSANGQRANANYFTVDGVGANIAPGTADVIGPQLAGTVPALTTTGGTNGLVSVDALQEFKIQTSSYAPEFGRTPGAQVSLVTRSGTNRLHGSLFEYFRNDALDANDWFSNRAGLPRAALRQNQFGGTLGGPLPLPRFGAGGRPWLSGRDRTFFFFSYEGLRLRQPQTAVTNVPALRLRQDAPPAIRALLNAFPAPTGPEIGATGLAPFTGTYSNPSTLNATGVRVDHNFSASVTSFGRLNFAPSKTVARSASVPSRFNTVKDDTVTATFGATVTLSPTVFDEARANYSRARADVRWDLDDYGGAQVPPAPALYPPFSGAARVSVVAEIFSSDLVAGPLNLNTQRQLNLVNNLAVTRGEHSLKFGVDYRRLTPSYVARDYNFGVFFLDQQSLLSGRASFVFFNAKQATRPVFDNFSAYGQDTWQATKRLTLTYGLRWEVNPPPHEATGKSPFVVRGLDNPATAALAPAGTPLWKTSYNNFAPRAGFAFSLFNRPGRETVLRVGAGLFYDLGNGQGGDAFTRAPFATANKLLVDVPYPITPEQATPAPYPTDASRNQIIAFDEHLKLPYTWQWNAAVEQSFGPDQTVSAAYVGALGRRQLVNQQFRNPNPQFLVINFVNNRGTSDYHSMQLQYRRRLSRGLQALASYTWAHAIDLVSDENGDLLAKRGNSDFDVRHNFAAAVSYDLPAPAGGAAAALLRDWSVDLIAHAQSAAPLTVKAQFSSTIDGRIVQLLPDAVAGAPLYITDPNAPGGRRVNRAAFVRAPAGRQGNLGRNTVRGFPLYQVDFALRRDFKFGEERSLQLRGEAFNLFNHPNFGPPVNDLTSPQFGSSVSTFGRNLAGLSPIYQIGGPRSVQLALRFVF